MALSAYTDGNRFLDEDKLAFPDANSYTKDVTNADRLVKAALMQAFGNDIIDAWINPATTPAIVIDISALLAASYYYRRIYSEETTGVPYYADQLEKRAMMLLDDIRAGRIGLDDETYVAGLSMTQANFWPNDLTVDDCGVPIRLFTMDMVL